MKTIYDITGATGVPVREVDALLARQAMKTDYEPSTRGRSRRYSLENAVEIALCEALRKAGLKPSTAVAYAHALQRQHFHQQGGVARYLVFPAGDPNPSAARSTHSLDGVEFSEWFDGDHPSFVVVEASKLVKKVKAFFEANGEEAA